MKATAIILILLCLAALMGIGYLYFSASLVIEPAGCIATDALSQPEVFQQMKTAAETETLTGTLFGSLAEATPENSLFYTYTLRIRNKTFLKAEVIEITITPRDGDLLQTGEENAFDLGPGKSFDLTATILTAKGGDPIREATVTYYFWGMPFSAKVVCK